MIELKSGQKQQKSDLSEPITIHSPAFREYVFSVDPKKVSCSEDIQSFLNARKEITCFPVAISTFSSLEDEVYYENTWMYERNFQGKHGHEGTDLLSVRNKNGIHPIVSMTDGIITKVGWSAAGGYRIGILSDSNIYYYYAHLDHYAAQVKENQSVRAGQIIGYMGSSGYGAEGTYGKFPVHLHVGIYINTADQYMVSVNPYHILKDLEQNIIKYNE